MKKKFKKCGSGDNVCNCTSADECGYSIPYENTTKKSLEDQFCKAYTEFHGEPVDDPKQIVLTTFTGEELMEFCQFYASQFVKKDDEPDMEKIINEYFSNRTPEQIKADYEKFEAQDRVDFPQDYEDKHEAVSSDVEQAFNDFWNHGYADHDLSTSDTDFNDLNSDVVRKIFEAGFYAKQSTQQPSISWMTDDEIENLFGKSFVTSSFVYGAKRLQSKLKERVNFNPTINWLTDEEIETHFPIHSITAKKMQILLKERVNCVDPVELLNWITDFESNYEGDGGVADKIRCYDTGWFWESDREGDMELTAQNIIDIYVKDRNDETKR